MSQKQNTEAAYLRGQLDAILQDMLNELGQAQKKMQILLSHGQTISGEAFLDGLLQIEGHRIQLHIGMMAAAAQMQKLTKQHTKQNAP